MDYGTDFLKSWELTEDGDIRLISGENNLSQGLVNRFSCDLNSLDLFYDDYGSLLVQFLGWKRNDTTLNFIKLELENRLRNEARLESFNVNVEYADKSWIICILRSLSMALSSLSLPSAETAGPLQYPRTAARRGGRAVCIRSRVPPPASPGV